MSAARLAIMCQARTRFLRIFENTVRKMISENTFQPGECLVTKIAEAAAEEMGVNEENVSLVHLHNHWRSAEFEHQTFTPMPPPPKRGMKVEDPVKTTTRFKVVAKSGFIEAGFVKINEDATFMGAEVCLCRFQRPTINNPKGGAPSSPQS